MSAKDRTPDQVAGMSHRHTTTWATGDGATVEFPLKTQVLRADDVVVTVDGALKRPRDQTGAFDYTVRGFFPAVYDGDKNRVKFTVAPAAGKNIAFNVAGG